MVKMFMVFGGEPLGIAAVGMEHIHCHGAFVQLDSPERALGSEDVEGVVIPCRCVMKHTGKEPFSCGRSKLPNK